jgi:hypothetical protein
MRVRVGENAHELAIDGTGIDHGADPLRRHHFDLERNAEPPERLLIRKPLPLAFVGGFRLVRRHHERQ